MSQSNCQFQPDFQWLPEVGDSLPEVGGNSFFNQIKKCWFHAGKVSVAWYITSDQFVQECSVATLVFPLKYPGHNPWILGGGGDGHAGWAGVGFCCLWCLVKIKYNKKLNSIKKQKASFDLSLAVAVFLSSLNCEMNDTSHVMGVYIV